MKSFLSTLFLFGIAMLLASPAMAQCPDGPSFMDGECMKDIYGIVYVAVPLGSQSPVLVNLDDDVDSAAGNSWGVTNAHPKFTIHPGDQNQAYSVFQTPDGLNPGSAITSSEAVVNPDGLVFVQLSANAGSDPFNSYWIVSVDDEQGTIREGRILFEFYDPACASNVPAIDPRKQSPPLPTGEIGWNNQTHTLDFAVTSQYLRDTHTMLVDFADFNIDNDNIRDATVCGNRPDLTGMPFAYLWESAETLDQPQSIGGMFGAYPSTDGTKWTVEAPSCDEITYSTKLSLSEMMSCRNREGGYAITIANNGHGDGQDIVYEGAMFWNVIRPIDTANEDSGYARFRTVFPFKFSFQSRFTAIVNSVSEILFRIFIRSAQLDTNGNLSFVVETQYPGTGLTNPTVTSGPSVLVSQGAIPAACPNNGPDDICIQKWTYTKNTWTTNDNGAYTFGWMSGSHALSAVMTIEQEQHDPVVELGIVYGECTLHVFDSSEDNMRGGVGEVDTSKFKFNPQDEILVRANIDLEVADRTNFDAHVVNAWICYTTIDGYAIEYDAHKGKLGCQDPLVLANGESIQLIDDYLVSDKIAATPFNARLVQDGTWNLPVGPSAGIGFSAFPITHRPNPYAIQLEVEMTQKDRPQVKKRMMQMSARALTDQEIQPGVRQSVKTLRGLYTPVADQPGSKKVVGIIAGVGSSIALLAGVAVVVAVVMTVRRRRAQRQQLSELPTVSLEMETL